MIVLAFAQINADGSVTIPGTYPCDLVTNWRAEGKKVLISLGGQNANWTAIFASNVSFTNAVNSMANIYTTTPSDGFDLDMEDYTISPANVTSLIQALKLSLRGAMITIAP